MMTYRHANIIAGGKNNLTTRLQKAAGFYMSIVFLNNNRRASMCNAEHFIRMFDMNQILLHFTQH